MNERREDGPVSEMRSTDGKYLCLQQGDGNLVVYEAATMRPLWDRYAYEATRPDPRDASGNMMHEEE